jgi:hypothetical protein
MSTQIANYGTILKRKAILMLESDASECLNHTDEVELPFAGHVG